MYDWGKEQEKEIATIKERTIPESFRCRLQENLNVCSQSKYHSITITGKFYWRSCKWNLYKWK